VNLIALETSTRLLSVALWRDGEILTRSEIRPNGGSDLILPWVGELLAEGGLALAQLDGIAFGAGPGGFTGLRLACGVAQGLAWGADLPVAGIGSLEALALEALDQGAAKVYACLDARMNEIYTAAYVAEAGTPREVLAPAVNPPGQIPLPPGTGWTVCGDGLAAYAKEISAEFNSHLAASMSELLPTAAAVARLAAARFARGEGVTAADAQPLYVRNKVALTTAERLARGGLR
jgi:tRNA threonylcarbamoyladenosine biosynthesis protein TsaB